MKTHKLLSASFFIAFLLIQNLFPQSIKKGDFLTRAIDTTANPGADFFKYATGTWMKENPIPPSERSWGVWNLVQDETYKRLKGILEEAAATKSSAGSNEQKIGDFYFTGMDSAEIEKQGLTPVEQELNMINSIKDKKDLFDAVAKLHREGVPAMFEMFVDQDQMKSSQYSLYLWQGGLGLPNRDYYFRNDSRTENIRTEYKNHLAKLFEYLNEKNIAADNDSKTVFQIETFLADSSRKLEDLRDPYANYNKMSLAQLEKISPSVNWNEIFKKTGVKGIDTLVVGQPEFFKALSESINRFSIDQWKSYLRWHFINSIADRLSSKFEVENFHFGGTVMNGVKEQRPRWKRVLTSAN